MAIKVIAGARIGGGRAENRRSQTEHPRRRDGHHPPLHGDGITDLEFDAGSLRCWLPADAAGEDAAVACVEHAPSAGLEERQAEGGSSGHEAGHAGAVGIDLGVDEDRQHRGRAVELAVPASEAGAGDEAAPALADERGAEEERGMLWREAEEDLLDVLLHQDRRRRRHAWIAAGARGIGLAGGGRRAAGSEREKWTGLKMKNSDSRRHLLRPNASQLIMLNGGAQEPARLRMDPAGNKFNILLWANKQIVLHQLLSFFINPFIKTYFKNNSC